MEGIIIHSKCHVAYEKHSFVYLTGAIVVVLVLVDLSLSQFEDAFIVVFGEVVLTGLKDIHFQYIFHEAFYRVVQIHV